MSALCMCIYSTVPRLGLHQIKIHQLSNLRKNYEFTKYNSCKNVLPYGILHTNLPETRSFIWSRLKFITCFRGLYIGTFVLTTCCCNFDIHVHKWLTVLNVSYVRIYFKFTCDIAELKTWGNYATSKLGEQLLPSLGLQISLEITTI